MQVLKRIFSYVRPYWRWAAATYAALLLATGLSLVVPWILRSVIDVGLTSGEYRYLVNAALTIIGLAVVRSVFSFLQLYGAQRIAFSIAYDMRNQLYDKIQHLPFAYHDKAQTGELISRATSDVEQIMNFTGDGVMSLLSIFVLFTTAIILMYSIDARLAIIALIPVIALVGVSLRFGLGMRHVWKIVQEQMAVMSTIMQETLQGIRVVKAFAREPFEIQRFHEEHKEYNNRRGLIIQRWATNFPLMTFTIALSTALILWFGGREVISGQLTVGTLVAFNTYLVMLAQPTQRLGFLVDRVSQAIASGTRFFEIIDAPSSIQDAPDAHDIGPIQGHVVFDHVSFAYGDSPVLKGISFEARPNQVVALMGLTGSGKSSIINLIPRFYDPTEGRVLIDGQDIRQVTLASLRRQIGLVLQDTFLFSSTIGENIAYGNPEATQEEIVAAAKAAGAHDFITYFPDGYETEVGERGLTLSGGQRQRLAIARALVLNPRILVLDDATSSVDPATEFEIQQALARLMQGRTTFVIAQRLLTLKNADQILVLDQGTIVQAGRHEELLQQPGLYRHIYDLQLRDQEETAAADKPRRVNRTLELATNYGDRGRRSG
ncbi:MAG: ABC transporter ATP-binding protein [Anaerolineae bacterium]|nr:ABC transporter ATP-binding protein [Anaerolineae bacterium]